MVAPSIKRQGITGQQTANWGGWGSNRGTDREGPVVGRQCPGKTGHRRIGEDKFDLHEKFIAAEIILEDRLALNPADDNVVQRAGRIYA